MTSPIRTETDPYLDQGQDLLDLFGPWHCPFELKISSQSSLTASNANDTHHDVQMALGEISPRPAQTLHWDRPCPDEVWDLWVQLFMIQPKPFGDRQDYEQFTDLVQQTFERCKTRTRQVFAYSMIDDDAQSREKFKDLLFIPTCRRIHMSRTSLQAVVLFCLQIGCDLGARDVHGDKPMLAALASPFFGSAKYMSLLLARGAKCPSESVSLQQIIDALARSLRTTFFIDGKERTRTPYERGVAIEEAISKIGCLMDHDPAFMDVQSLRSGQRVRILFIRTLVLRGTLTTKESWALF